MRATSLWTSAPAGTATLGGCTKGPAPDNLAARAVTAAILSDSTSDPYYTDGTMNADEILRRNDLAMAENPFEAFH